MKRTTELALPEVKVHNFPFSVPLKTSIFPQEGESVLLQKTERKRYGRETSVEHNLQSRLIPATIKKGDEVMMKVARGRALWRDESKTAGVQERITGALDGAPFIYRGGGEVTVARRQKEARPGLTGSVQMPGIRAVRGAYVRVSESVTEENWEEELDIAAGEGAAPISLYRQAQGRAVAGDYEASAGWFGSASVDTPLGQVNLGPGSRYEGHMGVSYWEETTTGDFGGGLVLTNEEGGMRIDYASQALLKPAGAVVRAALEALGRPTPRSLLMPSEEDWG